MYNNEKTNFQINPINTRLFSPIRETLNKDIQLGKDYNNFNQSSPLNFTPSKKNDIIHGNCTSLGETPLNLNLKLPFSPIFNNQGGDYSYQKSQNYQQNINSPFKPLWQSPIISQNLSFRK